MKYKMIASDFDGTLLRSNLTVAQKSADAIKSYIARGGAFVVSTGRMAMSIDRWKSYLGISGQKIPVIGFNGSVVTDDNGNVVASTLMTADVALRIIKKAMELGVYCHFYDISNVYVREINDINYEYAVITDAPLKVVGRLDRYLEAHPDMLIPKVMLYIQPEQREELERIFDDMKLSSVKHMMSEENYFEFVSAKSGKETGMKMAAELLGIPLSGVIAIGDNQNDVGMIKEAGLGVAVANACAEARAAADYIAKCNDDDPIAEIIEKFCGD